MKKVRLFGFSKIVMTLAAVFAMSLSFVRAQTPDGSSANPYPIRTAGQLISLAQRVNAGGEFYFNPTDSTYATTGDNAYKIPAKAQEKYFKLVADIDLNPGKDVASCDGDGTGLTAWTPMGTAANPFDGILDGDFHLIIGAYVNQSTANAGLFGCTSNHTIIQKLGVVNSYVAGSQNTGGLVGQATGSKIEKSFFAGTVSGTTRVGGLAGSLSAGAEINTCYSSTTITADNQVGGVAGFVDVSSTPCAFKYCYSASVVHGKYEFTGGFVGEDKNTNTDYTNAIYDKQLVDLKGGLTPYKPSVLVSENNTSVLTSGSVAIAGFNNSGGFYPYIDGFHPESNALVFFSIVPIVLPVDKTLSDLSEVSTIGLGDLGTGGTWSIDVVGKTSLSGNTLTIDGQSYVVLKAEKDGYSRVYPLQFDKLPYLGEATNPFPVRDLADLTALRDGVNSGAVFRYGHFTVPALAEGIWFVQKADITMPNSDWNSIGFESTTPFKGHYDGGGYKVSRWTCSTETTGFFCYTENATIQNLTIDSVKSGVRAALIYSMRGGTVDNCHAEGSSNVIRGGLIFETHELGDTCYIRNCTNKNDATSTSGSIGGILRQSGARMVYIDNCHNYGNLTNSYVNYDAYAGGIMARKKVNVTGNVVQITNCSNRGNIKGVQSSSCVGGIEGYGASCSYCFNTGNISNYLYVGAITAGENTISYCYNLGTITKLNYIGAEYVLNGMTRGSADHCFNAGKIVQKGNGDAYAISPYNNSAGTVFTCANNFNVGDVVTTFGMARTFQDVTSTTRYSLGRLCGRLSKVGGGYIDVSRVPSYQELGQGVRKTTSEMVGTSLGLNPDDWVCADSVYPRIKGLDTLIISKVLALPIVFGNATDNVDNVTTDFKVRSQWDITWAIEGTSGATISDRVGNYQTVTLPSTRTGSLVLAAHYNDGERDSVYYRISLVMAVDAPSAALTVENEADLKALRTGINTGLPFVYHDTVNVPAGAKGTTFIVTQDFSLTETNWTPIGVTTEVPFQGTFDGQNHTISKLKQTNLSLGGLFGFVENGTIKNLNLDTVAVSGVYDGGSVCGYLTQGNVVNCSAKGSLSGGTNTSNSMRKLGGIVGITTGTDTIRNCTNYMTIKGETFTVLGGIVGQCESNNTFIDSCINAGTVKNSYRMGGISGEKGTIWRCVNYGNLIAISRTEYLAGISANGGKISRCVNSGKITAPSLTNDAYIAGVALWPDAVEHSYNVGSISGSNAKTMAGVSVHGSSSSVSPKYCYNAGVLSGTGTVRAVSNKAGVKCYYDKQMSLATDPNAKSRTTVQMCSLTRDSLSTSFTFETNMYPRVKDLETLPVSYAASAPVFLQDTETVTTVNTDFTMGGCATHSVGWTTDVSGLTITSCSATIGSPCIGNLYASVDGVTYKIVPLKAKMDAFIVKNKAQLDSLRVGINSGTTFYYNPMDSTYHSASASGYLPVTPRGEEAFFRQSADIDMENATWVPIGTSTNPFKGTYDGNHFTIRNFTLNNQRYTGLFGWISYAVLKNMVLENVNATVSYQDVAALCGLSVSANIENITLNNAHIVSNFIRSGSDYNGYVGGIMGYMENTIVKNIEVNNSSIEGNSNYVAGVVGYCSGTSIKDVKLSDCSVSSTLSYVGGVAGYITQASSSFTLRNIVSENTDVSGRNYVGGLIGYFGYNYGGSLYYGYVNGGTVTSSYADGTSYYTGGIGGLLSGLDLRYCTSSATVKGEDAVGGIVGKKQYSYLFFCVNKGDVEGEDQVGGVVGTMDEFTIEASALYGSINAGKVKGESEVGGIIGHAHRACKGAAVQCVNLGDVEGTIYVGGIIGWSQGTTDKNANAGRVSGVNYVGGIVGMQSNGSGYVRYAQNSCNVGQVTGDEYVGSVAGSAEEGTLKNCYYDRQMSPLYAGEGTTGEDVTADNGAVGKLTREMLGTEISISGFTTEAGLYPRPIDLKDSVAAIVAATPVVLADTVDAYNIPGIENYTITPTIANDVTWIKDAGETFRVDGSTFKVNRTGRALLTATRDGYAKSLEFVVGVSSDMPCEIKDLAQLTNFTNFINTGAQFVYNSESKTFKATGDAFADVKIAAGGEGSFFKLTFDPDFETESWAGRIGTAAQPFLGDFNGDGHTVNSLRTANHDTCGFFGYNAGTVHDLSFTNTVMEANSYNVVGAVCGYNTGKITNCHLVGGTVAGAENVGAIAGMNSGWITNCHNSATVSGTSYTGGIAGANSKSITFCFNIGTVNGTSYLGGITGNNTNVLSNCYNSGRIKATGTSDYVGGVAGNTGNNISFCYNAGQVTTENTTAHLGAVAGACSTATISTLAYDEQVCYTMSAFDGGDYSASRLIASAMTGNGLKSLLGEENWVYADSMYPRLNGMETLDAAYVSATPLFMPGGDHTQSVEHNFKVYANHNGVSWTFANNENNTLDISNLPNVRVNRCGSPVLKVKKMVEEREIELYINHTAIEDVYDTTCGEPKVWALNGVQYTTSYVDVLNVMENGCPVTYTYHITIPTTMTVVIDSVPQQCVETASGSAEAHVADGFGNYKYEWRDESNNVVGNDYTLGSLNPGRYFLTVTDTLNAKTCVLRDTTTIKEAVPLSFTVDTVSPGCYNVTDGFFQVTMLGGAPSYTLEWSGAASGSRDIAASTDHYEVNGLPSGSYTLTLTDSHSCTATASATLTQNNDAYVITAYSNEKTYDGVTLSANTYTFQTGSTTETRTSGVAYDMGNGDMLTVVVSRGDLTDAGVYANEITSCVVMRGTSNVTCQYNITTNNGNVTIHKRPVTLTSGSTEVNWYEGMASITNHEMTVGGDGFATGETVTYNFTASLDHGGSIPNAFTINWGAVNRENYDTNKVFGTLTVIQNGVLTVNVIDLVTTYDGDEHTITESAAYTVYGLGDGQTAEVTLSETFPYTYKDADTVEVNIVSVVVKNSLDQDITSTFTTKNYQNGKIQVNPIEITLYSSGYTGVYDGEVHSQPEVFKVGNFIAADVNTPAVSANETIQNAGEKANTITINKTASYKDRNYHVTMTEGVLKVTKRQLYLTGVNTTIPYDGLPHTITEFTHSNLVAGHTLVANSVTFSATGTDMDEYTGSFSGTAEVRDFSNNDVSGNYQEMRTPGVLKIVGTAKELRISSSSKEEYYSGTAVKAHTYQVRFGGEAAEMINDTLFRITNDTVKIIVTDPAVIAGQKDAGTLRNSFGYTILPAAHADAYDNVVCDTGSIVVKPRPITFRSASFSRNYNATDIVSDSVEVAGMGFVEGEGATYTYQHGAASSRTNMGTYKNSFDYSFISGTLASNYIVTLDTGLLQVNPALVTIKTTVNNNDAGPRTRYYGNANDFSYTVDGLQGGEIASDVITGLDALTYTNVDQYANVGPYRVAANILSLGSVNDNYTFTADTVTLTVVKRPMTVHAVSQSVEYDGQLHNTAVTTVTQYEGLAAGDEVTGVTFVLPAPIYVGSSQMNVESITIKHGENNVSGNYSYVTADTSTLTITKKPLTITVTGSSKPYDGTALEANTTTCSYTCDGLVAGDEIESSSIVYEGSQTEVGSSEATLKNDESYLRILHGTTSVKSTAYEVTIVPGTLTVTKSDALVITLPTERTITYDGTTSLSAASTATAPYGTATPVVTYSTDGGTTFVSEAPSYTTSGTYTVNVRATCTNYNAVDSILTLTINRAPVTVTADDKTKKFGADEPELTWTPTGLQNSEPATILTVSISRVEGESIGTYAITPSGETVQGNYNVTYVPGTFTIVRDTVTVTAANKTKVYGATDPILTTTVDNTAVDNLISRSAQRAEGENVGDYTITVNAAVEQGNYYVKTVPGTFTITRAAATITADNKEKVYGSSDPEWTWTASGLVNGDNQSVLTVASFSRVPGDTVGTYAITPTGEDVQGNYSVTYGTGTLTITKKSATITVADADKVYGDPDPTFTGSVEGLVNASDLGTITYSRTNSSVQGVNVYPNVLTATYTPNNNYTVEVVKGTFEITHAAAVVKADDNSKSYGDSDPELTATVSGLKNGDATSVIAYDIARVPGDTIGTYTITPTGAATQGNYTVTYETGTFTIDRATVTVTADNQTKVYGSIDPNPLTATVTGLKNGDAATVITYTVTRADADENVGDHTLTASGNDVQGNYNVTYVNGKLTITPKEATVKADDKTIAYGDADPELTATVTGAVGSDVLNYTLTRAAGNNVGEYTISVVLGSNPNYDVTPVNGKLTITPKAVMVKADNKSKVYDNNDATDPELTATVTGLVGSDEIDYVLERDPGQNVNTYNITVTGAAAQGNYTVSYDGGKFKITKKDLTIKAKAQTYPYNAESQGPAGTYTNNFSTYVTVDGLATGDGLTGITLEGSATEVGTYPDVIVPSVAVIGIHGDNYSITYKPDTLRITPVDVTVKITGHSNSTPYDGIAHTVEGYDVTEITPSLYTTADFTFSGTASATRTQVVEGEDAAGKTNMGLSDTQFANTNSNFGTVTFEITDGYQEITPITATVTVTEKSDEVDYDGNPHTIDGYLSMVSDNVLYDVTTSVSETSTAAWTVTETNAGTYDMGIVEGDFTNTNTNFSTVTFNIVDGQLVIKKIDATVTIVGNTNTTTYDGNEHKVAGYTATASTALYDVDHDFTHVGDSIATRTHVVEGTDADGKTDMGLAADQFTNTNANFQTVTFNVTDGYQTITPKMLTITTESASRDYDGTPLTAAGNITGFATPGGTAETATFTVTGSQTFVGSSTNTYTLVWDLTAVETDYTLDVTRGTLTVNPVVVITTDPMPTEICSGTTLDVAFDATISGENGTMSFAWERVSNTTDVTGAENGTGNISETLKNITATDQTTQFSVTPTFTPAGGGAAVTGTAKSFDITVRPSVRTAGNVTFTVRDTAVTLRYGVADTLLSLARTWTSIMPTTDMTVTLDSVGIPFNRRYNVDNSPYTIRWILRDECGDTVMFTQTVTILYPPCGGTFKTNADGDGIEYATIQVGCNCWMAENSRTTKYADGTDVTPAPMTYGTPVETYGYLYTYAAATKTTPSRSTRSTLATGQGICPEGWHIPDDDDFTDLLSRYEAEDLMSDEHWVTPGTNASGFGLEPSGMYNAELDRYEYLYVMTSLWAFEPGSTIYHACQFGSACGTIEITPSSAVNAYSVRCVHNTED